jgi:hypothetical protein
VSDEKNQFASVLAEAKAKKAEYPGKWEPIYREAKRFEEIALQGKIMDAATQTRYGFKNARMTNIIKPYINNQANRTLQMRYSPVVTPNGGGADVVKAEMRGQVLRGLLKNGFLQASNQARRYQLAAGIRYTRIVSDYESERGFEQTFRIEDVEDTYSVFPDPNVQNSTFSDMRDFLIREDVPKELWKERTGLETSGYFITNQKRKTIWYYWRKKNTAMEKEYFFEDNSSKLESELPAMDDGSPDMTGIKMLPDRVTPFARDVSLYTWEWYVIDDNCERVFSSGEWAGYCAPLVADTGEKVIEGEGEQRRVHYYPLTREAMEPQLIFTIVDNLILLRLAKSPYSKWKIAYESIEDAVVKKMTELRQASAIGDQDVVYKAFTSDGTRAIPPPEEIEPKILDRILLEIKEDARRSCERALGIFDAALGEKTNERSGVAIKERAKQSDLSCYHFEFNHQQYVQQIGRVLLDAFPRVMTVPQQVAFFDKDDNAVMRMINTPGGITFDPNERYSLVIEAEPDSDSTREAEAEMLNNMVQNPALGPLMTRNPKAAALIVKAQKGRYARQIGEIMEQDLADPEKQAMRQQMQQMQEAGKKLQDELAALKQGKDLEALKEQNRHEEALKRLELDIAAQADKTEIERFRAETEREKVNKKPATPESILEPAV